MDVVIRKKLDTIWTLAAAAAAVLVVIAWSIAPPAAPAGPRVSEQALCAEARTGVSTLRMAVLVRQGGAVHSGVLAAASRYATGEGLLSTVVTACVSVGA